MTKEEKRAKDRAAYAANPEYYRNKALKYARRHKKARAEYTRQYRLDHPEETAAYKKANRYRYKGYAKAYRARNSDQYKATSRRMNLKKYGITVEDKENMCKNQNGCCAICVNPFKNARDTHVDHDHLTGKVRGLLCSRCNLILGHAKDSQIILKSAIQYLKKQTDLIVTEYLKDFDFTLSKATTN